MAYRNLRILFILPLLLTSLALAACSERPETTRNETRSGPDISYETGQALDSHMDQLGYQLALLDRELVANEYNQIDQDEVVAILQEMEIISSSFMAEDGGESHRFLQEDATAFIDSLIGARRAASDRPPRYYLAGKVAGSCSSCHQISF